MGCAHIPPACRQDSGQARKEEPGLPVPRRVLSLSKDQPGSRSPRKREARRDRTGWAGDRDAHKGPRRVMNDWTGRARSELLKLRDRSGAWGYRTDRGPCVEPTAMACLGLWSCRGESHTEAEPGAVQRG